MDGASIKRQGTSSSTVCMIKLRLLQYSFMASASSKLSTGAADSVEFSAAVPEAPRGAAAGANSSSAPRALAIVIAAICAYS